MKNKKPPIARIGSKGEALWTKIRDKLLKDIEDDENNIMVSRKFLATAEREIAEEKKKFKKL